MNGFTSLRHGSLALIAAAILMTGCNQQKTDEAALMEESRDLRTQLEDRNQALEAANADRRDLEMTNAELRRQVGDLESQLSNRPETDVIAYDTGFEGIEGTSVSRGVGEVTVSIASDVLFDSGKATLRPAARSSLDEVAQVISSQYTVNVIRIEGHTDTDPIKKSGWKSNYHLGSERAYAVMQYLMSKGVGSDRLYIASHGPRVPQRTKAASRRVEIVVLES